MIDIHIFYFLSRHYRYVYIIILKSVKANLVYSKSTTYSMYLTLMI